MFSARNFSLAGFALFFLTLPIAVSASIVQVGNCRPGLQSYATISAAVNAVPTASTVLVCPGNYIEQVVIGKALSLQGIAAGGADNVVIKGSTTTVNSVFGPVLAQVLIQNASGPVNISNITVDGSNVGFTCPYDPPQPTYIAGIFYLNSGGSIRHVVARNQKSSEGQSLISCGNGVWVENDPSSQLSVTIESNTMHDFDGGGIFAYSDNDISPALTVHVVSNSVATGTGVSGIDLDQASGEVSGNVVTGGAFGIQLSGPPDTIYSTKITAAENVIQGSLEGMRILSSGNNINSNRIANSSAIGIEIDEYDNTVQNNRLTSNQAAVEIDCKYRPTGNTVTGNIISDSALGIGTVPGGNTIQPNQFFNTSTFVGNCQDSNKANFPHEGVRLTKKLLPLRPH